MNKEVAYLMFAALMIMLAIVLVGYAKYIIRMAHAGEDNGKK